jgi:hypothetical protein
MYLVSVYEYLRHMGGRTHRRLTARHT